MRSYDLIVIGAGSGNMLFGPERVFDTVAPDAEILLHVASYTVP